MELNKEPSFLIRKQTMIRKNDASQSLVMTDKEKPQCL
jgi:hypothetical protein